MACCRACGTVLPTGTWARSRMESLTAMTPPMVLHPGARTRGGTGHRIHDRSCSPLMRSVVSPTNVGVKTGHGTTPAQPHGTADHGSAVDAGIRLGAR